MLFFTVESRFLWALFLHLRWKTFSRISLSLFVHHNVRLSRKCMYNLSLKLGHIFAFLFTIRIFDQIMIFHSVDDTSWHRQAGNFSIMGRLSKKFPPVHDNQHNQRNKQSLSDQKFLMYAHLFKICICYRLGLITLIHMKKY